MPIKDFPSLAHLVALLRLSITSAHCAKANLRYNIEDPTMRAAVLLLCAVVDHARAVISLARRDADSAAAIVLRSAIDAYVDIVNLCEDTKYWKRLEAADLFQWKRFLESASRGTNPNLEALRLYPKFPEMRRSVVVRQKALDKSGVRKLDIDERFQRAGLREEYESAYHFLSFECHNAISFVRARYGGAQGESEDGRVVRQHGSAIPYALTMSEIVIRSTEKILRRCGHGTAVVAKADRELERIHELMKMKAAEHEQLAAVAVKERSG